MHVFQSREQLDAELGTVRKWQRTGQALEASLMFAKAEAHSIGDSLVYWWQDAATLATEDFVGHRRYLTVISPQDGVLTVQVAPKMALEPTEPYSDLTDRERFVGVADEVTIPAMAICAFDIDEAYRVVPGQSGAVVTVHVTVEGYSFPNK